MSRVLTLGSSEPVYIGHGRSKLVEGLCVLCRSEGRLRLSHIMPHWGVKFLQHKLYAIAGEGKYEFEMDDEHKEYLLCESCEQFLGAGENYLARLCKGDVRSFDRIKVELTDGCILHKVNPTLVLRALLGIFFKVHYSESISYQHLRLPTRFLERLRARILADDYPSAFEVKAIRWLDFGGTFPARDHQSANFYQDGQAFGGNVQLAGVLFLVSFRATMFDRPQPPYAFLRSHEPWYWPVADTRQKLSLAKTMGVEPSVVEALPDERSLTDDVPCPCGLRADRTYAECCKGRWYVNDSVLSIMHLGGEPHICVASSGTPCLPLLAEPPGLTFFREEDTYRRWLEDYLVDGLSNLGLLDELSKEAD